MIFHAKSNSAGPQKCHAEKCSERATPDNAQTMMSCRVENEWHEKCPPCTTLNNQDNSYTRVVAVTSSRDVPQGEGKANILRMKGVLEVR